VLDKLLSWVVSADLNLRHGATLASAEMILALKNNGFTFPQGFIQYICLLNVHELLFTQMSTCKYMLVYILRYKKTK
jgi:hypothetical protein